MKYKEDTKIRGIFTGSRGLLRTRGRGDFQPEALANPLLRQDCASPLPLQGRSEEGAEASSFFFFVLHAIKTHYIALCWFVVVLSLCLIQQIYMIRFFSLVIPAMLYLIPACYLRRLPVSVKTTDIFLGILGCVFFVLPFVLIKVVVMKGTFVSPPGMYILTVLMLNALPEELFFRGYLQESLGNRPWTVALVSAMFTLCHSGRFLVGGDITPLLTFFPSLMMGWLYLKTSNVLPAVLFHFVANLAFTSMR
ncbi:abortive infection protein [Candidatus Magnetobacterium bavaricum]|uniref:Abortive infection protein n=1 Tax=Candidatus Magnetobacterium bavaricum TaxID=29290 RepID=A0A0F3GJ28_9BACT|nr:abortive infection protein [Candidatus Magnetobacterium bavaricum]